MPPARLKQESVKLLQQRAGSTLMQNDVLALGAPDLSLHGVLVKTRIQLLKARPQVQRMHGKLFLCIETFLGLQFNATRPNFGEIELLHRLPLHCGEYRIEILSIIDERFAVV